MFYNMRNTYVLTFFFPVVKLIIAKLFVVGVFWKLIQKRLKKKKNQRRRLNTIEEDDGNDDDLD